MKNWIQPGETVTITATASIDSGQGRLEGAALFGVAAGSAEIGDSLDLVTIGIFDLSADLSDTWVVGAPVYWNEARKVCVASASDDSSNSTDSNSGGDADVLIGVAVASKGAGVAVVRVRLNGAAVMV